MNYKKKNKTPLDSNIRSLHVFTVDHGMNGQTLLAFFAPQAHLSSHGMLYSRPSVLNGRKL